MKTVLLLVPTLGIGGQEKIAINTVLCLKDIYHVELAIFQKEEVQYEYPCDVINLNLPAKNSVFAKLVNQVRRIFKVAKLRRKIKPDVVISFGSTANITNIFSGIISSGRCVSAIHGFAEVKKSVSLRSILRFSDKVICIARAMQDELLSIFPKAKNTVVIENGYEIESVAKKYEETPDTHLPRPAVVSMGRLEHVKGFDRLIKAFAIVKKQRPDLSLVLLGKGSLYDSLKDLIVQEGVENSVLLMGYQSNPYAYLRESDVYVLSSRSEGFPNALIEALCCKLPIVAMDCSSGPREILSERYSSSRVTGIVEEKYGVLVEESVSEEHNVERLANAILLLANDAEKRSKYQLRGRERANQFNNEVYRDKIVSIIENI